MIMAKTRIEELVEILSGHIDVSKLTVGTERLYIPVTDCVDIIVEMFGPMYDVWIQNHDEGEGCTVARTDDRFNVASFVVSVFKMNGRGTNG